VNHCEQELCRNWSGDGNVCPCAVFGIEPDVVREDSWGDDEGQLAEVRLIPVDESEDQW